MKSLSFALLMAVAVVCVAYVCAAPPDLTSEVREGLGSAFRRGLETFGEPQKVLNPAQKELAQVREATRSAFMKGLDMFDPDKDNNPIVQTRRRIVAAAARR